MKAILFLIICLCLSAQSQTTVSYAIAFAFSSNNVTTNGTFPVLTNIPSSYSASMVVINSSGTLSVYSIPQGSNVATFSSATNIGVYIPTTYPRYGDLGFASPFSTSTTGKIWPVLPGTNYVNSMQWTLTSSTGVITTIPNITISNPTTTNFSVTISAILPAGESLHWTLNDLE